MITSESLEPSPYSPYSLGEEAEPGQFPALSNMSGAFFWTFLPRPFITTPVEYVTINLDKFARPTDDDSAEDSAAALMGFIGQWNTAWEADMLRYDLLAEQIPPSLAWLEQYSDRNITLVPTVGGYTYPTYLPLYHLLPRGVLLRNGLPILKRGIWPASLVMTHTMSAVPPDFNQRMSRAFAEHIWPELSPGSSLSSFQDAEPLRLLAHNLHFWLPYVDQVIQERLRQYGPVPFDDDAPGQQQSLANLRVTYGSLLDVDRPLKGGPIWRGEDDARHALRELIEVADTKGRLRGIIEAIRTHRVEEDFSDRWSFAREDFERRLYKKRNKVKVTFVELKETIPVYSQSSEVHDNFIFDDFLALLDPKERSIVVCLRSGMTNLSEVSEHLGYANHSPVSKALARIRRQAIQYLND